MTWRLASITLVSVITGCASVSQVNRPTLVHVFAELRRAPHKEPVIIIPGALGSILEDTATNRVVWGRVRGARLAALGLPIDGATLRENRDHVVAKNILERMVWVPDLVEFNVSNDLIGTLQEAGGYDTGDLAHPKPGDNCFLFWYDWRRDLVEAAQQLGAAIDRLATEMHDPDLKVHLVAYSMGGLVARYYVKYGTADVLDQEPLPPPSYAGARHVAQVILLGTPNNGSLETFRSLQEGVTVPGIGHVSASTVFTMPAAYQLLPHDEETVFLDAQGRPLEVSLYDPANWPRYGWSIFNPFIQAEHGAPQQRFLALALARAQRFHRALDAGHPAEDPVEYVVLGSDCRPTLQRAVLEPQGPRWRTRFTMEHPPLHRTLFGFGDGSVTKDSLIGSHHLGIDRDALALSTLHVAYAVFVCETHVRLTQNLTFLDNLLHALLVREATAQHQATCLVCQRRVTTGSAQDIGEVR
jgi:pimeloyl-ACP methyl ester carboxylesterase